MGGGLMQLVAYGAQDIYLTGNPQITFFKVVYRRHTNFSMETIEQTINGSQTASGSGSVTISRNGDLVHKVYVTCENMTAGNDGTTLIDNVELEIGGQKIDKQTTQWNQIWADLSTPASKAEGYKSMIGACGNSNTNAVGLVQVPLNFWFCRNPGLALPLIALQYHEVKLKCVWGAAVGTRKVVCDYIYLDTDERRRFAQVSHEYLIEQVQEQTADASGSFKLNFNHPVKELIWTSDATNTYGDAILKLNGHDRFSKQQEEYFQLRQPYDYHTSVPGQNVVLTDRPQLLAQPELIIQSAATQADNAQGTAPEFVIVNHATTDQLLMKTVAGDVANVKVGDILQIQYPTVVDAEGETIIVKITAVPTTFSANTNDQKFSFLLVRSSANTTGIAPTASVVGSGNIVKIASPQDPLSKTGSVTKKINCYSFALKPEEHQPSGTCNFSRIDNAQLKIDTSTGMDGDDTIYAVNYNVLRIMSGMGGLAYSN
jgi:hypothetical protein